MNGLIVAIVYVVVIGVLIGLVKYFAPQKTTMSRYVSLVLLSMIVLGSAWGLAQYFVVLSLISVVLEAIVVKYCIRTSWSKAAVIAVAWTLILAVLAGIADVAMKYISAL
jgi:hypothetical protein